MKAIAFGEILWDVFGSERTLGGAPLNVAGHINRLGGESMIVSAVGNDKLGEETLKEISGLGISTECIGISEYETGKAIVSLKDGIPSYSFTYPSAWDAIILSDESIQHLKKSEYDVLIFGTLAQRSRLSHDTLFTLIHGIQAREKFFDVNLRLDFYTEEIIRSSLEAATILKMNDEEVPVILKMSGCDSIGGIFDKYYNIRIVLVTCGKKGTYCYTADNKVFHAEPENVPVLDTVGAGDSLSAGFLYFYLNGNPLETALSKASRLADYVVQKQGAIPEYDEEIKAELM